MCFTFAKHWGERQSGKSTLARIMNTGLGLSICQHIVELHGGVLLFESIPGDTTFTVRLPMASEPGGEPRRV
jgi:signal transduction histidine kinase